MGTMTVRENLEFSAALRLPSDFTKKDREKRVNSIIEDLGLFRCADTRVSVTLDKSFLEHVCRFLMCRCKENLFGQIEEIKERSKETKNRPEPMSILSRCP